MSPKEQVAQFTLLLEGTFDTLCLTFLSLLLVALDTGISVRVPPEAMLELTDGILLFLPEPTSLRSSVVASLAPIGSGGGRIVFCIVRI
jgi:hypothetical protein